jgi:hypothetical protein
MKLNKPTDLLRSSLVYFKGSMAEQTNEWWKGLGEELETDIETLSDETK